MSFWNPNLRFDDLKCTFAPGAANAQKRPASRTHCNLGPRTPSPSCRGEGPPFAEPLGNPASSVLRLVRIGMPHHQFEFVFAAPFCIETCNQNFQIFPLCVCVCAGGGGNGGVAACVHWPNTHTHTHTEWITISTQFNEKCRPISKMCATHRPLFRLQPHGAR